MMLIQNLESHKYNGEISVYIQHHEYKIWTSASQNDTSKFHKDITPKGPKIDSLTPGSGVAEEEASLSYLVVL